MLAPSRRRHGFYALMMALAWWFTRAFIEVHDTFGFSTGHVSRLVLVYISLIFVGPLFSTSGVVLGSLAHATHPRTNDWTHARIAIALHTLIAFYSTWTLGRIYN